MGIETRTAFNVDVSVVILVNQFVILIMGVSINASSLLCLVKFKCSNPCTDVKIIFRASNCVSSITDAFKRIISIKLGDYVVNEFIITVI